MSGDKAISSEKSANYRVFGINASVAATIVLITPILFTLIAYPDTFSLAWNEGRGGFIFAMAFIAAELIGIRRRISERRFLIAAGLAAITITYFAALPYGLQDSIRNAAPSYDVVLVDSWIWMWDFVVMCLFLASSLFVLYGTKWYKIAPAGAIYLAGNAAVLSLDAFFPFDTLGPLQVIVPIYLQIDQGVINFIDQYITNVGPENPNSTASPATARGNLLILNGLHGPFALQVFWPSAGVHSMIIYTLVMLAFLLKMEMPTRRKLMYFAIGTFGTVSVNIIRITALSLYALVVTTKVAEWEAFHSVAGEIMFLPWLGVYLAIVIFTESRRLRRMHPGSVAPSPSPATRP